MKRLLLISAAVCSAMTASAQWKNTPEGETPLYSANRDYPAATMATSATGQTWFHMNEIRTIDGKMSEVYFVQGLDAEGNTIMGADPAPLAQYKYQSWTMVNNNIFTDSKGNAIMAVQDYRDGGEYHQATVYKISPTGEQLWGENGITLTSGLNAILLFSFTGCEMSDGSYVFAWVNPVANSTDPYTAVYEINIMRVEEDGTLAWEPGDVKLSNSKMPYNYPFLIDGGNAQFNLVYAEGSNETIKVMRYDFDGTPVWGEAVEVYNGGWGSTPMWTKCEAKPSGDGGVLFAWYDDRYFTNYEDSYLAYVTPKGELGFNQPNGIKLDYTEYTRDLGVSVAYDKKTDSFVAIMRAAIGNNQSRYVMKAQRISKNGDLLWGEEAKTIAPDDGCQYGFASVIIGEEGRAAFFYEMSAESTGREVNNCVAYYDIETGEDVWGKTVNFGAKETPKSDLQAGNCGEFMTASWMGGSWMEDPDEPGTGYYSSSVGNIYVQRINFDGTVGSKQDAIESVNGSKAMPFSIEGKTLRSGEGTEVYDLSGRLVGKGGNVQLETGIYTATNGTQAAKFVIK